MATVRSFVSFALVGTSLISLLTACPSVCPDAVYSFEVTATYSPEKDSIQVGDTLYLTSSFPTKLPAGNSNQLIDYSNAVIGGNVFFDEIPMDKSSLKSAVNSFLIFSTKGQIYTDTSVPSPERIKQTRYQQTGTTYELLFGFVPRKKGLFCLTLSSGYSTGKPNDGCDSAGFSISLTNTDQHLHYLTDISGIAVSPYVAKGAYCFKVY